MSSILLLTYRHNLAAFIKSIVLLSLFFLMGCEQANEQKNEYQWPIISGFPKPQVPINNAMSAAKVELGRAIFYDANLSANKLQSCSSCHHQEYAFAENIEQSIGSTGQQHRRNAPALVNIAYNKTLTWAHDNMTTLERQILLPMFGEFPVELGITNNEAEVIKRFRTEEYKLLFSAAFPNAVTTTESINFDLIVKSLSSFVRSLISLNSPFDQYAYYGNDQAISDSALRGMNLFFSEKLECHHCHGGFNFTQSTSHEKQLIDRRPFHNTGLYNVAGTNSYPSDDSGLSEVTNQARDNGRFRAPTLRNIAVTAPYMHDGSVDSLSEVLDIYAAGGRNVIEGKHQGDGRRNTLKSSFIKGFKMTEQDKADLLAFLNTLTDKEFLTTPKHAAK